MKGAGRLAMVGALVAALAGCSETRSRVDPPVDPACAPDRGRVDAGRWRERVDHFGLRTFDSRRKFRLARDLLIRDLMEVRMSACDWELPTVDSLVAEVQEMRFR